MKQFDSLAELDDAMKNLATLYPASEAAWAVAWNSTVRAVNAERQWQAGRLLDVLGAHELECGE